MSESELTIKIPKPKGKLNLPVLINFLERHMTHLYEVYNLTTNIDATNILLGQITKLSTIIGQLKGC
jgi:hypothetical protein